MAIILSIGGFFSNWRNWIENAIANERSVQYKGGRLFWDFLCMLYDMRSNSNFECLCFNVWNIIQNNPKHIHKLRLSWPFFVSKYMQLTNKKINVIEQNLAIVHIHYNKHCLKFRLNMLSKISIIIDREQQQMKVSNKYLFLSGPAFTPHLSDH